MAIKLINKLPEPSEHDMQCALFAILKVYEDRIPEWKAIYAIPNGAKLPYSKSKTGKRFSKEAVWLLKEGMKPGTPDICCPFGVGNPLYIEMKRPGKKPDPVQHSRIKLLKAIGNNVQICTSTGEAMIEIIYHTIRLYQAYAGMVYKDPSHIYHKTLKLLTQIQTHKY